MCLTPIQIRNPTRRIDMRGGQPLLLNVPCGHCAECKKNKRLEWRFRSYYHAKHCIDNGGFVYFDTLTYRPECVPRLSRFLDLSQYNIDDFMCFDSSDWKNFLKNMRRQLDYHYKGSHFTYFITSEYGTDERYTHRPHYHILFFVFGPISPLDFSSLVAKCWHFGRTDGLPYQPTGYVLEHVFRAGSDYLKVCNYVAKYVTKDSTFQTSINNRLTILEKKLDEDTYKTLKRNIDMFHRQSQGYGHYFLDTLDVRLRNLINKYGIVIIEDDKSVVAKLPLPLYYRRKLFYKCIKNNDKYLWIPTNEGVDYLRNRLISNVNYVANSYYNIYLNLSQDEQSQVDSLLNGRTLFDFSTYLLLYRGRLRSNVDYSSLSQSSELNDIEYNTYDWLNTLYNNPYDDSLSRVVIRDDDDKNFIQIPVSYGDLFSHITYKNNDYGTLISNCTFTEHSCSYFSNFDKLFALFSSLEHPTNINKQKTFDFIEQLTKKFNH